MLNEKSHMRKDKNHLIHSYMGLKKKQIALSFDLFLGLAICSTILFHAWQQENITTWPWGQTTDSIVIVLDDFAQQ